MLKLCPHCAAVNAIDRVRILPAGWGGSPRPALAGDFSDLIALRDAGLAMRDVAGWWRPTEAFPVDKLA